MSKSNFSTFFDQYILLFFSLFLILLALVIWLIWPPLYYYSSKFVIFIFDWYESYESLFFIKKCDEDFPTSGLKDCVYYLKD